MPIVETSLHAHTNGVGALGVKSSIRACKKLAPDIGGIKISANVERRDRIILYVFVF